MHVGSIPWPHGFSILSLVFLWSYKNVAFFPNTFFEEIVSKLVSDVVASISLAESAVEEEFSKDFHTYEDEEKLLVKDEDAIVTELAIEFGSIELINE